MNIPIHHASPARSARENLEVWFKIICQARLTVQNRMLLEKYFSQQFFADFFTAQKFLDFLYDCLGYLTIPLVGRKHLATQYLGIIRPVAERFGFFAQREKLDDAAFCIQNQKQYKCLAQSLKQYKNVSQKIIDQILRIFRKLTKTYGFEAQVSGRYKSLYSIAKKLAEKKRNNIFTLQDIFAFRIVLTRGDNAECFDLLGVMHDKFTPLAHRFKDYITIPKVNGYQGLHTGITQVIPDLDLPIEVQIRTRDMDEFAENGLAAHWIYSSRKKHFPLARSQLAATMYPFEMQLKQQEDWVYFLSPKGDVFALEKGATGRDFAYALHSQIGEKAISIRIDGKDFPLSAILMSGDMVHIVMANRNHPSP